jgi:metallo-beta-lactamase family protein
MATDIAEIYARHPECLQPGTALTGAILDGVEEPLVHYIRSREESEELAKRQDSCIIVASGGMCEGGRIVRHLRQHIDDPRSTLVLVSYQAPHSLGCRLLDPRPTVRFHGRTWNKWIEVVELNGFSGHADHNDFLTLLEPLADRTAKVRLVHGEPEQAEVLAGSLRNLGFADVGLPARGDELSLG